MSPFVFLKTLDSLISELKVIVNIIESIEYFSCIHFSGHGDTGKASKGQQTSCEERGTKLSPPTVAALLTFWEGAMLGCYSLWGQLAVLSLESQVWLSSLVISQGACCRERNRGDWRLL